MKKVIGQFKNSDFVNIEYWEPMKKFTEGKVYYFSTLYSNDNENNKIASVKLQDRIIKTFTLRNGNLMVEGSFLCKETVIDKDKGGAPLTIGEIDIENENIMVSNFNWATRFAGKKNLKIGIQGPPGLKIVLNGELINMNKNGLFYIDKDIKINHLNLIPDETGIFLIDYEYEEEVNGK